MMKKICYCRTPDCLNEGVPFEWEDSPVEGDEVVLAKPWCGGCSTEFPEIVDPAPEAEPPEEALDDLPA